MAATGTAHGDGDPVAAFRFHLRQHEAHQVKKLLLEFLRGLGGKDIVTDSLVLAAEGTQFFYKIGIGQKAQVKDEIRLARDAVLEAERDDVDPDGPQLARRPAPALLDGAAQVMDGKTAGIYDQIRHLAHGGQTRAFLVQGILKAHALTLQRMGPAGGGITAHELLRSGFQKKQYGPDPVLGKLGKGHIELFQKVLLAHVHAQGHAPEAFHGSAPHHLHHLDGQPGRQPVHSEIAQVFKDPQRRTFTGPRKAGDYTDLDRRCRALGWCLAHGNLEGAPLRGPRSLYRTGSMTA